MANVQFYYNEEPVGIDWTVFGWDNLFAGHPNGGKVYAITLNNDASNQNTHDHIFVSFGSRVDPATGNLIPNGLHDRLYPGEERMWMFFWGGEFQCSEIWLKCNTNSAIIPVPKRLQVYGVNGPAFSA